MNIKDLKSSFESLKQRVLKTEGQKAAAEIGKIVSAINEAVAEKNNTNKYKLAMQKVYNAISKAEDTISNNENLADLQSLVNKLNGVKVGDIDLIEKAQNRINEYKSGYKGDRSLPDHYFFKKHLINVLRTQLNSIIAKMKIYKYYKQSYDKVDPAVILKDVTDFRDSGFMPLCMSTAVGTAILQLRTAIKCKDTDPEKSKSYIKMSMSRILDEIHTPKRWYTRNLAEIERIKNFPSGDIRGEWFEISEKSKYTSKYLYNNLINK